MLDVVNLTMRVKDVKTKSHVSIVTGDFAYSREYSKWKMEKTVQQVKVENSMSFTEARKIVEVLRPAATGKTYGAMVKVSTTSVAIQTDLTWSNGEEKKKWLTLKKKPLDSRNPPKGLSGEPGPSKPTTGKDTKHLTKDTSSGRLKKAARPYQ